jgi:hypothetical protein
MSERAAPSDWPLAPAVTYLDHGAFTTSRRVCAQIYDELPQHQRLAEAVASEPRS